MKIKLLEYREQKQLTLAVLSKMTGLGTGRLSEIETGVTSDPRMSTLIKIAGAWMIKNHNEEAMVVDMLASMHITKELMQQEHVAEEDYEILSEAIDSNWGRYVRQLPENI